MPIILGQYIDSDGQVLTQEFSGLDYVEVIMYRNSVGELHRLDGPAMDFNNGANYRYFKDGKRHRIGGPAIVWNIGNNDSWWIEDERVEVYYIYG